MVARRQHSYFDGCSTGGREAMIMSQRYPEYFDGIISGDPAIRTGHSNLALGFMTAVFDQARPKTIAANRIRKKIFSESDRKLIVNSLLQACDAKDGLKDGMIFNQRACDFDPATLVCSGAKTDSCLTQSASGCAQEGVRRSEIVVWRCDLSRLSLRRRHRRRRLHSWAA